MTQVVERDEQARTAALVAAEARALELFEAVVERRLLRPGVAERAASDAIRNLAGELFGVARWWHKRIVRAGPNTLLPYRENPPDRLLADDDIAFLDFGPIVGEWEADLGRSYVLGDDPRKHALNASLADVWDAGRNFFAATPDVTGAQLYERMCALAEESGWVFGGHIAGHVVGQFPHEEISPDGIQEHVMPGSDLPMRRLDDAGLTCHWILEVHLVDRDRNFGGFYEQLLDIGPNSRVDRGTAQPPFGVRTS